VIVLDTNVVSELMKLEPAEPVLRWMDDHPAVLLYVTSITQAEILYGIRLLPRGRRRDGVERAAVDMFEREFEGRMLGFDGGSAEPYADIAVARRRSGRPISTLDAQIAAIARVHGASLATRNLTDLEGCGIDLVDPFGYEG
jgi:hypothetical protein